MELACYSAVSVREQPTWSVGFPDCMFSGLMTSKGRYGRRPNYNNVHDASNRPVGQAQVTGPTARSAVPLVQNSYVLGW